MSDEGRKEVEARKQREFEDQFAAERAKDKERLNAAVKQRFGLALSKHALECPICLVRGPSACKVGKILYHCALHGVEAPDHAPFKK